MVPFEKRVRSGCSATRASKRVLRKQTVPDQREERSFENSRLREKREVK